MDFISQIKNSENITDVYMSDTNCKLTQSQTIKGAIN